MSRCAPLARSRGALRLLSCMYIVKNVTCTTVMRNIGIAGFSGFCSQFALEA